MRTKLAAYYDKERDVILHGVMAFAYGEWCRVHDNGTMLLFEDVADAEAERAKLRKRKDPALSEGGR